MWHRLLPFLAGSCVWGCRKQNPDLFGAWTDCHLKRVLPKLSCQRLAAPQRVRIYQAGGHFFPRSFIVLFLSCPLPSQEVFPVAWRDSQSSNAPLTCQTWVATNTPRSRSWSGQPSVSTRSIFDKHGPATKPSKRSYTNKATRNSVNSLEFIKVPG